LSRSLLLGQVRTIVLLFVGYAACYYCRADLSVATPLLVEELGKRGVQHGEALVRLGSITSFGVLVYALGKLFLTGLGDYWGGRRNFLIGVGDATVFTVMKPYACVAGTIRARSRDLRPRASPTTLH
jgi:sugar phosphate permease